MKNKTVDTLCQEILESFGNCISLGISGDMQAPQSYENFVLVARVNKNYNIVTIADNNIQIKISRDWLADAKLKVEISETEDHDCILDFLTDMCTADLIEQNEEAITKQIDIFTTKCGELYDLMKAPQ